MTNATRDEILLAFKTVGIDKVTQDITRLNNGLLTCKTVSTNFAQKSVLTKKALQQIGSEARIAQKQLHGLQMKFLTMGLSMLFAGMAVQRFSMSLLRGLFDTLKKVEGSQTTLEVSIMRMSASFEFLKFSLLEALNGSFIESFIVSIAKMLVGIADWISQNKAAGVAIVAVLLALAALATAVVILGQIFSAWSGWIWFFEGLAPAIAAAKLAITGWWAWFAATPLGVFAIWTAAFLLIMAAIILILEMSGIDTKWLEVLTFMAQGWNQFWDGILTSDDAKIMAGFEKLTMGIAALFWNLIVGISELITKKLLDMILGIVDLIVGIPLLFQKGVGLKGYSDSFEQKKQKRKEDMEGLFDGARVDELDLQKLGENIDIRYKTGKFAPDTKVAPDMEGDDGDALKKFEEAQKNLNKSITDMKDANIKNTESVSAATGTGYAFNDSISELYDIASNTATMFNDSMTPALGTFNDAVLLADGNLTKHSLVPSMDMLIESTDIAKVSIDSMRDALGQNIEEDNTLSFAINSNDVLVQLLIIQINKLTDGVRSFIDAILDIPTERHVYVYTHYVSIYESEEEDDDED